jgi:hypothetical protein
MRRHYTNYFKGIYNFKPYRARLVEGDSYQEVLDILDEVSYELADSAIITI